MSSDRCWESRAKVKNGARGSVSVLLVHPPSLDQASGMSASGKCRRGQLRGREGSHRCQQEQGWGPPAAAWPPGWAAVVPIRELCKGRPAWLIAASRRVTECQNAWSNLSIQLSNCFGGVEEWGWGVEAPNWLFIMTAQLSPHYTEWPKCTHSYWFSWGGLVQGWPYCSLQAKSGPLPALYRELRMDFLNDYLQLTW